MVNIGVVQSVNRYLVMIIGPLILLLGLIGNALTIIVFLNRKRTVRKSPCTLYFISMSIIRTLHLVHFLIYLILSIGFGIDPTLTSVIYCKLRYYLMQATLPYISVSFECAAAISQFLATSRKRHHRKKNTLRVARICIFLIIVFWCLQGIPFLIIYKIQVIPVAKKPLCDSFNTALRYYKTWFLQFGTLLISLFGILPLFGYLTLRNIRRITYSSNRQQRTEQQMSSLLLVQIIFYMICWIPLSIWSTYLLITERHSKNLERQTIERLADTILRLLASTTFASSFYLFYATSEPFRTQFKVTCKVLCGCSRNLQTLPSTVDVTSTKSN